MLLFLNDSKILQLEFERTSTMLIRGPVKASKFQFSLLKWRSGAR